MPARHRWTGPMLVAAATLSMLGWTWQTWADPLVDFGTQLYVPWRIVNHAVLYRDVAYYNGPLSSYINSAVFELFGVGIHRIEAMNFVVLVGMMIAIYRLTIRAAGRWAAVIGGIVIATVFAFGQNVELGNYNWMTPYTTELTHGVALGLLTIAVLDRHLRTGRIVWLIATGLLCGAVLLTKAEPTAACAAALLVRLAAWVWVDRPNRRRVLMTGGVLIGCTLILPLLATALLTTAMPLRDAVRGAAGSWPWAFDRRVTSLPFYRRISGMDDVGGNVRTTLAWAAGYAAVSVFALGGAWLARRRKAVQYAIIAFVAIATIAGFAEVIWPEALRPLPLVLMALAMGCGVGVVRRRDGVQALRLTLVVYALALLGKLWLVSHAYHYGFALALPGTLVLVAVVVEVLPKWAASRGGNGRIVRGIGLCLCAAFVAATLLVQKQFVDRKQWMIAAGTGDSFRVGTRGLEVAAVVNWIDVHVPPTGTVAVMPQGPMVNYLARRATPTRQLNLMPPEVLAVGEPAVVTAFDRDPPSAVVLDRSAIRNGAFTLDQQYAWGRAICRWVATHDKPSTTIDLPPPMPTLYGFQTWVDRANNDAR